MASAGRWFRRILLGLVAFIALAFAGVTVGANRALTRTYPFRDVPLQIPTDSASIARGAHLARVTCAGCHGEQLNGHLMFEDAVFARFVAPGLADSLPRYSDAQLAGYIRHGVRPDGISPLIMSPAGFHHMSDADLAAVIAYLRQASIPPSEPLGRTSLGPIGKALVAFGLFKTSVNDRDTTVAPVGADTAATGSRMGEYLVRMVCADCHGAALTGSSDGPAPSPSLAGALGYSLEEFRTLIRTGEPREAGKAIPDMANVSRTTFMHLTDEEIAAIHSYLAGLPATGVTLR